MLKQLKNKKKKKGFTLIELIIVLAILAIIALIAIPNFNKVREDSRIKADKMSLESIAKVIEMQLIDENIPDTHNGTIIIKAATTSEGLPTVEMGEEDEDFDKKTTVIADIKEGLKGIEGPQEKNKVAYSLEIKDGVLVKESFKTLTTSN